MRTRAPLVLSLCLLLPIVSFAAKEPTAGRGDRTGRRTSRHFVLEPQHVLSDAERSELADNGCIIQRALPGGRYLVSISGRSTIDGSDLRVKSLTPLTAEVKMDVSAYRAAAQAKPFARINVLFHDDASFAEAQRAIEEAGGAIEEPLARDFGPMRSLRARVPSMSLVQLAEDESVLTIYAARTFRATTWNADEAAMSNVTPLYSAPYNLSGSGVVLSYFELAPAQASHPEFEGRLSIDFTCSSSDTQCANSDNKLHATHVAGTMIAAGINATAKGMAPKATLHEFEGADPNDAWLGLKDTALRALGSVADNNSWGYVLGWSPGTLTSWTWNGADELIGGYDGTLSAVLDHIAITGVTLMLHASGNEGGLAGPTAAPFKHSHVDDQGNETKDVYCYSSNGSGTDCPVALDCTAGTAFCETTRHPVHAPYGSVGWTASGKNIVAVGAVDSSKTITGFTSRGPTKDGRIKPDLVAKGRLVFSTAPPANYATESGTSMATPVVTGSMALFAEQWRKTFGGSSPAPAVLKALAIAGAEDLGNSGPDFDYGFGLLNAKNSVDLIVADGGQGKRIKIDNASNGSQFDYRVTLSQAQDLRVVLSWFDPEALPLNAQEVTTKVLINDLDVKVVDPSSNTVLPYVLDMINPTAAATKGVNTVDNTEEVEIKGATPGVYHVIVNGTTVTANPPQQFVLIANAEFTAAPPPCTDPTEPNSTAATAYGPLATNSVTQARICDAADVDFFRFTPNASGVATIVVTASDTLMTVSVGSGTDSLTSLVTRDIAAGASQTFTINALAATQYLVSVKPNGTVGSDGGYKISTTYPFTWPARRRSARR